MSKCNCTKFDTSSSRWFYDVRMTETVRNAISHHEMMALDEKFPAVIKTGLLMDAENSCIQFFNLHALYF